MATTATSDAYATRQIELAAYAKALAHPARIAIMEFLHAQGNCYCGDLVSELPIAQSTVSQHLKELREAGLIRATSQLPKVKYCIERERWEAAKKLFCHFFDET